MQLNDFTTLDPGTFKLRRYEVSVSGFSEPMSAVYLSTSRGKAMADAWRSDIFSNYTFGEFLKIARCRLSWYQAKPTEIEVLGERVWGLGHNRQYVQFVRPNGDHVLKAHPLDVLPVSARPKDYQPAPSTSTPPASRG